MFYIHLIVMHCTRNTEKGKNSRCPTSDLDIIAAKVVRGEERGSLASVWRWLTNPVRHNKLGHIASM